VELEITVPATARKRAWEVPLNGGLHLWYARSAEEKVLLQPLPYESKFAKSTRWL
jgi:hypothetical protein